ncbi:MAG TPA: HAD family hydrolase [Dehalococcoidia bacterium]
MASGIRAIIFDMGNTLWFEARTPARDDLHALLSQRLEPLVASWQLRLDLPAADVHFEAWDAYMAAEQIERERGRFVDPSLPFLIRGALAVRGHEISEAQADAWWRAAYLPVTVFGWQLYPDTLDVLRELKSLGIRVGVNTNRPFTSDMFTADLDDYGIAPYVDAVVCSGDTGYYKPHPSTFRLVLERLGVLAAETLMVGDDCLGDMQGARGVGMQTVWKLNGRYDAPRCSDADYAIHDLAELLALPLLTRAPRPVASTESLTPHEDNNEDRY